MPVYLDGKPRITPSDIDTVPGATWEDTKDTINQIGSAGAGEKTFITDAGGGNFDVAAGKGFIRPGA